MIVNNTATNTHVQLSVMISFPLAIYPIVGLLDHMVTSTVTFEFVLPYDNDQYLNE